MLAGYTWTSASFFSDNLPAHTGSDYFVGRLRDRSIPPGQANPTTLFFRSPEVSSDATFPGNSLTIDTDGYFATKMLGSSARLTMNLKLIGTGTMGNWSDYSTTNLYGTLTIHDTPAIDISGSSDPRGIYIYSQLSGNGTLSLLGDPVPAFKFMLANDANTFSGNIVVRDALLILGTARSVATVPNISLTNTAKLQPLVDVDAPDTTLTVAATSKILLDRHLNLKRCEINGIALTTGTHTGAELAAAFPGQVVNNGGSITVSVQYFPAFPRLLLVSGSTEIPNGGGPVDFGVSDYGDPPVSRTFALVNYGDAPLLTSNLAVPAGFSVADGLNATIPADTGTFESWSEIPSSPKFSARTSHRCAVFKDALWVIGGSDSAPRNDVWKSGDGSHWTQVTATAPFSPRYAHGCLVFQDKLWVLGGFDNATNWQDVWNSSDGVNWTRVATGVPCLARGLFGAVAYNDQLWIMAGVDVNGVYKNDVWRSSDGINWVQVTAAAPFMARYGLTATVHRGEIWVIGGVNNQQIIYLNDVWHSFDGRNWTQASAAAGFSPRTSHLCLAFNNKLWVIGGAQSYHANETNDVWSSPDGINWTQVMAHAPFSPRSSLSGAGFLGNIWIIGGGAYRAPTDQVWRTNFANVDTFTIQLPTNAAGTFSGQVRFDNNDTSRNPFLFSLQGTVLPPPPVLAPGAWRIDDSTSYSVLNNADGQLNGGETARLGIALRNTGGSADGVTGTLATTHPLATVIDAQADWGAIAIDETKQPPDDFMVKMAPSATDVELDASLLTAIQYASGLRSFQQQDVVRVTVHASPPPFGLRELPVNYTPGLALPVSIEVTPPAAVSTWQCADTPPSGWTVSGISDGGVWDQAGGCVRWGPFSGTQARTLTYQTTPPPGEDGAKTFAGRLSLNSESQDLGGESTLVRRPVIHVDAARPDDSGDGLNWATAKKTLQAAIDAAVPGGAAEVWVRAGNYRETRPAEDGSLNLVGGVSLYGGFAGDETSRERCDPIHNLTVIDGSTARAGAQAEHVIRMEALQNTRLDGFTVTGGRALTTTGGGLYGYMLDQSNAIANCVFENNNASEGGGLAIHQSNGVLIENCTIQDNHTNGYNGGGGMMCSASQPTISKCRFLRNVSESVGGAMECIGGTTARVVNCVFSQNVSGSGSAIHLYHYCRVEVYHCTFDRNGGTNASAINGGSVGDSVIVNSIFSRNAGYGILCDAFISRNNLFFSNGSGAAYYITRSRGYSLGASLNGVVTSGGGANSGNIDGDPLLSGDFRLGPGSPAIDAGTDGNAPATDLNGLARPVDVPGHGAEATGKEYDLGATEVPWPAAPLIDIAGAPADFGSQLVRSTFSVQKKVVIHNRGFALLTFAGAGFELAGADAGNFALAAAPSTAALDPGTSRTVSVIFAPTRTGSISATLRISTNDPVSPSLEVPLRGVGLPTIFADPARPDDSGDGLSWATAKKTLQASIDTAAAAGGGAVWAKAGTFNEVRNGSPDGALVMKNGVHLMGGFAGTETTFAQRSLAFNQTTISGAKGRNGIPAWHVVRVDNVTSTRLDGFTIQGGRANGSENDSLGAGLFMINANPTNTVANCTFSNNIAGAYGGALSLKVTSANFESCVFAGNSAGSRAGAIFIESSSPVFTGCAVRSNSAANEGGGVWGYYTGATFVNCSVDNNSTNQNGGGMHFYFGSATLTSCTVTNNRTVSMGGGLVGDHTVFTIRNCRFTGNTAADSAAISFYGAESVQSSMEGTVISENQAGNGGGIGCVGNNSPTITNCVFTGNKANGGYGGAVYCLNNVSPQLINCTLAGNSASWGGAVCCYNFGNPILKNLIISGNSGGAVYEYTSDSDPVLEHCLFFNNADGDYRDECNGSSEGTVQNGAAAINALVNTYGEPNTGNIEGDPRLIRDYILGNGSAALDRGVTIGAPATDIAGHSRPVDLPGIGEDGPGVGFDIGAWESVSVSAPIIALSTSAIDFGGQGLASGPTASRTLVLTNGGYTPLVFRGAGIALDGGWSGEFLFTVPPDTRPLDPGTSRTISLAFDPSVLGAVSASLLITSNDPDLPEIRVDLRGAGQTTVFADSSRPGDSGDGLNWATAKKTLQAAVDVAAAAGGGEVWAKAGVYGEQRNGAPDGALVMKAGVRLYGGFAGTESSFTQRDTVANVSTIDGAHARAGAAAYHVVRFPAAGDCRVDGFVISGGRATSGSSDYSTGGGIYFPAATGLLEVARCVLQDNLAANGGGAYIAGGSPVLTDCTLRNNSATDGGGALYAYDSRVVLTGCAVNQNTAGQNGGGIMFNTSYPVATHCTFTGNSSGNRGGGIYSHHSTTVLDGCTLTGNRGSYGGGMFMANKRPGAHAQLLECAFANNTCPGNGGALYLDEGNSPLIRNGIFSGNDSEGNAGGALYCLNYSSPQLLNCTFSGNAASIGSALTCAAASSPDLRNCIFQGNAKIAVIEFSRDSDPLVRHCLFHANPDGDYLDEAQGGGGTTLSGPAAIDALINYTGAGNSGNLAGDPLFVNADAGDFHLQSASAAIDAGEAVAINFDCESHPRPIAASLEPRGDGSHFDVGAYEYARALLPPQGAPDLVPQTINIDDSTSYSAYNNMDGILNGGETVHLGIALYNRGSYAASVTGLLTTTQSLAAIPDPSGVWGAIHPGQAKSPEDDFIITMAPITRTTEPLSLFLLSEVRYATPPRSFEQQHAIGLTAHMFPFSAVASRVLPRLYAPAMPITVRIQASPADSVAVWRCLESVPAGWTIDAISDDGVWDQANQHVTWGPFQGGDARTLTYRATPPPGEAGDKLFSGLMSLDGVSETIGGDSSVALADETLAVNFQTDGTPGSRLLGTARQLVRYGADCTPVTAESTEAHYFVNWTMLGNELDTSNPLTFKHVIDYTTLTANFALLPPHSLIYNAGPHGSIGGTAVQTVNNGADGTPVTALPDRGYYFVQWSDGSTVNPRTDVHVLEGVSVSAEFARHDVIHVDHRVPVGGNGSSWAQAKKTLPDALAAAIAGEEIWVAAGTYLTTAGTDQSKSFIMEPGVALYGGFAGTETSRQQRDWTAHETILSGDLGYPNDAGDNAYHVVIGAANAILDGFTVTGGTAPQDQFGGGMFNQDITSLTIANCVFSANTVRGYIGEGIDGSGGAVYNKNVNALRVDRCTFTGNSAMCGAGVFNDAGTSHTFTRCDFVNNVSYGGAGLQNSGTAATVAECNFISNQGNGYGGGMASYGGVTTVSQCRFTGNNAYARGGGAMYLVGGQHVIADCIFEGNLANTNQGGAIMHGGGGIVTRCVFSGNEAGRDGGGVYNEGGLTTLTSCLFNNNRADTGNGGAFWSGGGSPQIANCTFSGNQAAVRGGGLFSDGGAPSLANCIFWDNAAPTGPEIFKYGALALSHSDVQGCGGSGASWNTLLGTDGGGNLDTDPRLVNSAAPAGRDGLWKTGDDGLRLRPDSPCLDAGSATAAPPLDLLAHARYGVPDLGAYEYQGIDSALPLAPANLAATLVATGSLRWSWADNSDNESGFRVWADAGATTPTTPRAITAEGATGWTFDGLTPNVQYACRVAAVNNAGESSSTLPSTAWTLAAPPVPGANVACDRTTGTALATGTAVQFDNPAGFGAGAPGGTSYRVTGFHQAWTADPAYAFDGSEPVWSGGALVKTSAAPVSCYLHLQSLNAANQANPQTLDLGPFVFALPPSITLQPAPQTVDPGAPAEFGIVAAGTEPLLYQWKKNGAAIEGANEPTLKIAAVSMADAAMYSCEVANVVGQAASGAARLVVNPTLTVASPYGTPAPAAGSHRYTTGTLVQAGLGGSPILDSTGTTRLICAGWVGAGSVPANGVTTQTSFNLGLDSTLTWTWKTQYQLATSATPADGGQVVLIGTSTPAAGTWHDAGTTATLRAIPRAGWIFTGWSGDASGAVTTASLLMSRPRDLTALFIQKPAVTSQPLILDLDPGRTAVFTLEATGTLPLAYQWTKNGTPLANVGRIAGADSPSLSISAIRESDEGWYQCAVSNIAGTTRSLAVVLVVKDPPQITGQPIGVTVNPGAPVSFSVSASGTASLAYQWRKNGVEIAGATQAAFEIASVAETDEGSYDCVVSNSAGTATSNAGELSVNDPVVILAHPQSRTVAVGAPVTFEVAFSGTWPVGWQWYKNGAPILGATQPSYTIEAVRLEDDGNYHCVLFNICNTVVTNSATLTVEEPVSITAQPVSRTVNPGASVTFSVAASGTGPISYQWKKGSSPIPGATGPDYTIGAVTEADEGSYACDVTNVAGTVPSHAATLSVNDPPSIAIQPFDLAVNPGAAAGFAVTAAGTGPLSYQWRKDGVNLAEGERVSGANTSALQLAVVRMSDAAHYDCVVTNIAGSAATRAARLVINPSLEVSSDHGAPAPAIGLNPLTSGSLISAALAGSPELDTTGTTRWVCTGWLGAGAVPPSGLGTSVSFTLDRDSSIQWQWETQYQLMASPVPASSGQIVLDGTSTPAAATWHDAATTAVLRAVAAPGWVFAAWGGDASGLAPTASLGLSRPRAVTAAFIQKPWVTLQPSNQRQALGASAAFDIQASGTLPLVYQWHRNGAPLANDGRVTGADSPVLRINPVQFPDEGSFFCVVTNAAGTTRSLDAELTVIDPPHVVSGPMDQIVNPGATVTFDVIATGTPPLGYQWRKNGVPIAAPGMPGFTIENVTEGDEGSYDCLVDNAAGTVASTAATLSVNDPVTITIHPVPRTVNPGASVTFAVTASGTAPLAYQWKNGSNPIPGANAPQFTIDAVTENDEGLYSCEVANIVGAAASDAALLSVNDPPRITVNPATQTVNPGSPASFRVVATGTPPLAYQWQKNGVDINGATAPDYAFASTMADAGFYRCVVANMAGTTASLPARLTVNPTLSVGSAHGLPNPSAGAHVFTTETLLTIKVSGSPELDANGTTRFVCAGWAGNGALPVSGTTTVTTCRLDQDSSITWRWNTQFQLRAAAAPAPGGQVTLNDGLTSAHGTWHDPATTVTLRAVPAPGWGFIGWNGAASGAAPATKVFMNAPRQVTANFIPFPTAPGGLAASDISATSINWTWQDRSDNETGFKIWADAGSTTPTTLRSTTAPGVTLWRFQGLLPNAPYSCRVAATNAVGDSSSTAPSTSWTAIEPVTGLQFANVATGSLDVSVTGGPFSNLGSGGSGILIANATAATDSGWRQAAGIWTATGLTPNTPYTFLAKSRNLAAVETLPVSALQYTMAGPPSAGNNVACDKAANGWFAPGTAFAFTNPAGFGAGTHDGAVYRVSGFRVAWDRSPAYAFSGSETAWNAGSLIRTASSAGSYYLHLQSLNGAGVANPATLHLGPYRIDAAAPSVPGAPSAPSVVVGTTAVTFSWAAAADPGGSGVASYDCQAGTTPGAIDVFSGNVGAALNATVTGPVGRTIYCRVRAVDAVGNVGGWSPNSPGTLIDTPPNPPGVAINPAVPYTRDDIDAVTSATDSDAGDSVVAYRYEWRLAGNVLSTSPTLSNQLTTRGDDWTLVVWARDSYGAWSQWGYKNFTIADTPPTQPLVEIRPKPAHAGQNLIVDIQEYSTDADGDEIAYDFKWYKSTNNGLTWLHKVELDHSSQVVGDYIEDGDLWEVRYIPYEVVTAKIAKGSKPFSRVEGQYGWDRAYIGTNTPPKMSFDTIYAQRQAAGTLLLVNWSYYDVDGQSCTMDLAWTNPDQVSYQPIANGLPAAQGSLRFAGALPTDLPLTIQGVIRDSKGALSHVLSAPVVVLPPAAQMVADGVLGKTNTTGLDLNLDHVVDVADVVLAVNAAPPESPTLVSPANGAAGIGWTPALDWSGGMHAQTYQVYLWKANTARPATPAFSNLAGTACSVAAPLLKNTRYCWQVVAVNGAVISGSPIASFTTSP